MNGKINFACSLQEGAIPDELRPKLAAELTRISVEVLGADADAVEVAFRVVAHGYGFRGGEISTTSTVRGELPPGFEQSTRVEFLQRICDMWMEVTSCEVEELVASAPDRQDAG